MIEFDRGPTSYTGAFDARASACAGAVLLTMSKVLQLLGYFIELGLDRTGLQHSWFHTAIDFVQWICIATRQLVV